MQLTKLMNMSPTDNVQSVIIFMMKRLAEEVDRLEQEVTDLSNEKTHLHQLFEKIGKKSEVKTSSYYNKNYISFESIYEDHPDFKELCDLLNVENPNDPDKDNDCASEEENTAI